MLRSNDIESILEEFFLNLENNYSISSEMAVGDVSEDRFTFYGGIFITFVDGDADKVYILEYHS